MWQDLLLYQVVAGLPPCQVDTHIILSLMEFLCQNGNSKANIANYMAAVRTLYSIHGLPTEPFRDQRIQLYLKSLKLNAMFDPTIRPTLDVAKLHSLLVFCVTQFHIPMFSKHCIIHASFRYLGYPISCHIHYQDLTLQDTYPGPIS